MSLDLLQSSLKRLLLIYGHALPLYLIYSRIMLIPPIIIPFIAAKRYRTIKISRIIEIALLVIANIRDNSTVCYSYSKRLKKNFRAIIRLRRLGIGTELKIRDNMRLKLCMALNHAITN